MTLEDEVISSSWRVGKILSWIRTDHTVLIYEEPLRVTSRRLFSLFHHDTWLSLIQHKSKVAARLHISPFFVLFALSNFLRWSFWVKKVSFLHFLRDALEIFDQMLVLAFCANHLIFKNQL